MKITESFLAIYVQIKILKGNLNDYWSVFSECIRVNDAQIQGVI